MPLTTTFMEFGKMTRSKLERAYEEHISEYFENACGSTFSKLENFAKFVPRQDLARFLFKYEVMKLVLPVHGSIVECGVHMGGGTFSFAQVSAILEPYNYQRKVVGFDTFEGFTSISKVDQVTELGKSKAQLGAFKVSGDIEQDLEQCNLLYDQNRPLNHIRKVQFIKGDASDTISHFINTNPELIVSLLYLDFDIYEPTKAALELLVPRIPKGGVIAFDEINNPEWPGETIALQETLGLSQLKLQRFPFEPARSFVVVE